MLILNRHKDVAFALAMIAISASLVAGSYQYPPEAAQFPRFLMVLQLIFSVLLLIRAFRTKPATPSAATATDIRLGVPLQVFVGVSAYILAIEHIGYFVTTALFLLGSMSFFGRHKLTVMLSVAGVFLLIIYILFGVLIGIRLPAGFLI